MNTAGGSSCNGHRWIVDNSHHVQRLSMVTTTDFQLFTNFDSETLGDSRTQRGVEFRVAIGAIRNRDFRIVYPIFPLETGKGASDASVPSIKHSCKIAVAGISLGSVPEPGGGNWRTTESELHDNLLGPPSGPRP